MSLPIIQIPSDVQEIFNASAGSSHGDKKMLIKRILMVGALLDRYEEKKLDSITDDDDYLWQGAKRAVEEGFEFSKDAEVRVCNLKYYDSFFELDKLGEEARADFVIFCNLYMGQAMPMDEMQQDPKAQDVTEWGKAFKIVDSKFVMNTGFDGHHYPSLNITNTYIRASNAVKAEGEPLFYDSRKSSSMSIPYRANFFTPA